MSKKKGISDTKVQAYEALMRQKRAALIAEETGQPYECVLKELEKKELNKKSYKELKVEKNKKAGKAAFKEVRRRIKKFSKSRSEKNRVLPEERPIFLQGGKCGKG